MSSSAFFIEAAANTVMALSCAATGEGAAPNRMMKAANIPARRCMVALRAGLRRALRAQIRHWLGQECDRRKRRSGNPDGLRPIWTSRRQAYSIVGAAQRLCVAPAIYGFASGAVSTAL